MSGGRTIYISQGEDGVSGEPDVVISTILGSCVSFCLYDADAKIGGMNHLLLPEMSSGGGGLDTVGAAAMDLLINKMVHLGASRKRLQAKVFGGASMLSGLTDIGARNAAFARAYLASEGMPCHAESLGGAQARRLRFHAATGRVQQKFVNEAPVLKPVEVPELNSVELF
ncbi:chemotaxis protein CheD [Alphaproteobacteria bacterium GH1-50]|uniref:Probable chemoreceptor glutamine deamidase CheD n=1 Tax=Kangsaoukella pontilimi TaxID=2691042 RepID=A0A7C9M8X5_9RHOB|nr:chemotaxis protein CheD [Kangsaoukella pontilimi]MXQ06893.1 chemotaxis protein CheD [Kangsaoukella pontilimi]